MLHLLPLCYGIAWKMLNLHFFQVSICIFFYNLLVQPHPSLQHSTRKRVTLFSPTATRRQPHLVHRFWFNFQFLHFQHYFLHHHLKLLFLQRCVAIHVNTTPIPMFLPQQLANNEDIFVSCDVRWSRIGS